MMDYFLKGLFLPAQIIDSPHLQLGQLLLEPLDGLLLLFVHVHGGLGLGGFELFLGILRVAFGVFHGLSLLFHLRLRPLHLSTVIFAHRALMVTQNRHRSGRQRGEK